MLSNQKQPLVSIITPSFNSEKFIAQTIQSVLNQTYNNWEMIIIDDASTDLSTSIILDFVKKDNRIQLYSLKKNSGTGVARNFALKKCKGDYIAFLDADDLWKREKLQKQIDFLIQKQLSFTFSFYDCINENGQSLNKTIGAPRKLTYKQLFFCNYIGNLTGIYSVAYFGKITIDKSRKRQDWTNWLTILKSIKTAQPIPESLAFYRVREDSISASKIKLLKYNFDVYKKYYHFNFIKASFCMIGFLFTQLLIKPRYIKKNSV